jgi:hypothetical protein
VVFHAADEDGWAIELLGSAAEVRMERVARGFVAQERTRVLGGENQMNVNGRKGLWHGKKDAPTGHRPPAQRCGNAATLGYESNKQQPQRGCGEFREWRHNDKAAHPGERGIMIWTP